MPVHFPPFKHLLVVVDTGTGSTKLFEKFCIGRHDLWFRSLSCQEQGPKCAKVDRGAFHHCARWILTSNGSQGSRSGEKVSNAELGDSSPQNSSVGRDRLALKDDSCGANQ